MKKIKKDNYISHCSKIHDNKFDYSLVDYKGMRFKIKIICPKHGVFEQFAQAHYDGLGCDDCRSIGEEKFIEHCNKIHGNEFVYKDYKTLNENVTIYNDIVGEFYQNAYSHYNGSLPKKIKVIFKLNNILQGYKILSCDDYLHGVSKLIKVKCPNNHTFNINVPYISRYNINNPCNDCKNNIKMNKLINEKGDFNNYEYKKTKFNKVSDYCIVTCKKHGDFRIKATNHFHTKQGCSKCKGGVKLSLEDIKKRTTYKVLNYIGSKVKLNCDKHGTFYKRVCKLQQGCPKCSSSGGEKRIRKYLKRNSIVFKEQHTFDDCVSVRPLRFDFFLPEHNTCIEYDGIQHFEPIDVFGGEKAFKETKIRDSIKTTYCKNNKINLLRITYLEYNSVNDILNKLISF